MSNLLDYLCFIYMEPKKPHKKREDRLTSPWLLFQIGSETQFLKKTLIDQNYNMSQTAKFLGIQRSHLYNLIKKYKIKIGGIPEGYRSPNVQEQANQLPQLPNSENYISDYPLTFEFHEEMKKREGSLTP